MIWFLVIKKISFSNQKKNFLTFFWWHKTAHVKWLEHTQFGLGIYILLSIELIEQTCIGNMLENNIKCDDYFESKRRSKDSVWLDETISVVLYI